MQVDRKWLSVDRKLLSKGAVEQTLKSGAVLSLGEIGGVEMMSDAR